MVIDVSRIKTMSFPPLPTIPQDIYMDVVTHRSLQRPAEPSDHGDTERLSLLGEHAMRMVVAHYIFSRYPSLTADGMKQKQEETLSNHNYRTWVNHYTQQYKLRLLAAPGTDPLTNDEEMIQFFHTYVGAVYHKNGLKDVISWIWGLLEPYDPAVNVDTPSQDGGDSSTNAQPPSYQSQQQYTPPFQPHQPHPGPAPFFQPHQSPPVSSPFFQPHQSPPGSSPLFQPHQSHPGPSPPTEPAPPLPNGVPTFLPNGVSSLITLGVVNQTAVQRGLVITYEPEAVGLAHSPIWTVRCMINGAERGRGQGKNQKVAKEEAARQAWVNMGW
ncbi:hypothetical protein E1B28_001463 [Marasmius oreades]|uniref:DRBM domain-containing protein n=1 Tax=Marasmius oreades TaxID=181124 RepID=A0A9P7V3T1_9AGAR|nr:uncharacterized protein E1B28_001463 [Marasmius oreades]KAG7099637.1 hypothetical protein E1B28_001463 [Marasmius oreades]